MIRRILTLLLLSLPVAGCSVYTENEHCFLVPGTEAVDVTESFSVSPDGRWLVFSEYHRAGMIYTVTSLDLETDRLLRHQLAADAYLVGDGRGRGTKVFDYMGIKKVAWRDGLFYGVWGENKEGQYLILDPQQQDMKFSDTTRFPKIRTLACLDRPHHYALQAWRAQHRASCTSGNAPAVLSGGFDWDWAIPFENGKLGDSAYVEEDEKLVRVGPGGVRETLARTAASLKDKSIMLIAVTADERYVAYEEVGKNRAAVIGGHVEDEIRVIDLRTGKKKLVTRASTVGSLEWMKDNRTLYFSADGKRTGVFRVDMRDLFGQ